jgi:carboxypeptidase C (cathepsin A)
MSRRVLHILSLLIAFTLYTIPLCQCAAMMNAQAEHSCCAQTSEPKSCTDEHGCCANGINAEKMNTEKSFESAQVSLPSVLFLTRLEFPVPSFTLSERFSLPPFSILSPPTPEFLQVFLI